MKVIHVTCDVRSGVTNASLIVAYLGAERDDGTKAVIYPRQSPHTCRRSRYLQDLQLRAWTTSLNVVSLGYDSYFTELQEARVQAFTLGALTKRLERHFDGWDRVRSFGETVVGLAVVLRVGVTIATTMFVDGRHKRWPGEQTPAVEFHKVPRQENEKWIYVAQRIDRLCKREAKIY